VVGDWAKEIDAIHNKKVLIADARGLAGEHARRLNGDIVNFLQIMADGY
jgi:hypothetical protein